MVSSTTITDQGALLIPESLRDSFGLTPGSTVIFEETERGLLLRPSHEAMIEIYTDERIAEFEAEFDKIGELPGDG